MTYMTTLVYTHSTLFWSIGSIAKRWPCLSDIPSLTSFGWASTNDNVWISNSGSNTSTCHEFMYTICCRIRFMRGCNIFHTLYAIAYGTYVIRFVYRWFLFLAGKYCCCCCCCCFYFWSLVQFCSMCAKKCRIFSIAIRWALVRFSAHWLQSNDAN